MKVFSNMEIMGYSRVSHEMDQAYYKQMKEWCNENVGVEGFAWRTTESCNESIGSANQKFYYNFYFKTQLMKDAFIEAFSRTSFETDWLVWL